MNSMTVKSLSLFSLFGWCFCATASEVNIPNTFVANQPAVAAEVNANFDAVAISINDNDNNNVAMMAILTQLQTDVAQLTADLSAANSNITGLTGDLADTNAALLAAQGDIVALSNDLVTANNTLASHNNRITAIEGNTVLELDGYLMLSTVNGYDTAEFTDINVQINNNTGSTAVRSTVWVI